MGSFVSRLPPRLVAASFLCLVSQAQAGTPSSTTFECPDYPSISTRDVEVGGKVSADAWKKLIGGEVDGKVSVFAKKLLADGPDANKVWFMQSLLAFNCRVVQQKNLSDKEKLEANERFNELMIRAIFNDRAASASAPTTARRTGPEVTKFRPNAKTEADVLPSARLAAKHMLSAAMKFKNALKSSYAAALGGAYVPVLPYELMQDSFMLSMAAKQDMMQGIPNVKVFPADNATSIGFDTCTHIGSAQKIADKTLSIYGAKMPEILYQHIDNLQKTVIYQYFHTFFPTDECDVFLGEMKNARAKDDPKYANRFVAPYAIPVKLPVFSESDFAEYVSATKRFEEHTRAIAEPSVANPKVTGIESRAPMPKG